MESSQKNEASSFRGSFFVLFGALCFSTSGTLQAIAPEGVTPFIVGASRMLVGGVCLFLWCLWKNKLRFDGIWDKRAVIMSVIAVVGLQLCFFSGIWYAGVAVGTVVAVGISPIAVALLSFIFHGERPKRAWYFATLLAIIGLILLNYHAAQAPSFAGIVLPLMAGFCYALYFFFSKPLVQNNSSELVTMVLCLCSGIVLSPLYFMYPVSWMFTFSGIWVTIALGVVTTALGFSVILAGIKITPSSTASTLSLAEPLGAACWGILLLGEPVTSGSIMGMIFIFTSMLVLIYFGSRRKA